ncbi:MAG: hypothetical protein ACE5FN_10620 [Leptospirillia bacterium]
MRPIPTIFALFPLVVGLGAYSITAVGAAMEEVEIIESNLAYDPETIRAAVGQTVRLTNQDPFFHQTRVTRLLADGAPGEIVINDKIEKKNTSQTFVPQHKGEYQIRCMVHDGMEATLHVD